MPLPRLTVLHAFLNRALMRVEKPEARSFYEQEAATANWSVRELERQIGSRYYERLLLSRDKRGMLMEHHQPALATHPLEILKDPYVVEFLNRNRTPGDES